MNIEKRINLWVSEGLLNRQQGDALIQYEAKSPKHSWALYGAAGVGIAALMSGVISIIAANWEYFSHFGKLAAYFFTLMLLGFFCVRFSNRPSITRESLLLSFSLFVLAGIGLIGQMYHLESDGWRAFAFWCVLTFPVATLAQTKALPHLWFAGFYAALGLWLTSRFSDRMELDGVMYCLGAMYATLAVSFGIGKLLPISFIRAARNYAVILGLLGGGYAASMVWSYADNFKPLTSSIPLIFTCLMLLLTVVALLIGNHEFSKPVAKSMAVTVLLSGLLLIPPISTPVSNSEILGCILFLLPWTGVAVSAALADRKRLFDLAAFVIGARIVTVYFQVFGSLAATGIGLIVSGSVILFSVYVWHRYRGRAAELIREQV